MAWTRKDDTAFHPRVLGLTDLDDERLLNEARGSLDRCLSYSAEHYLAG